MLKVVSYNIRKAVGTDRLRRPDRVLAVLAEVGADIAILQEADHRLGARLSALPFDLLAQAGWIAVGFGIRPGGLGWHGNAILVRTGLGVDEARALHLPTLEPRGAVTAEITVAGLRLRVVGMHLDLSGLLRRRQAHSIIAQVDACPQALPTLLAGDLNEWSQAGGCLAEFGRHYHFAPTAPSFHARRPMARLDRIMVSGDLAVLDCGTHRSALSVRASDHLPVWATVAAR